MNSGQEKYEEGVEIPLDRINPDTLRRMIEEFVTREWDDHADFEYSLDEKVNQVLRQLNEKRAKIVFDCASKTWNIIACR